MQERHLVSVVIPVFNGEPFVQKAVASILDQGVPDVEIIIVDDGSTDGTLQVLKNLERESGIAWYQAQHGGPARSRNLGLTKARGQFLALLDCDDWWLPGKLESQLNIMELRKDVGVVHTDYEEVYPNGDLCARVRARYSPEPLAKAFVGGHASLLSTLLIRRSILDKIGLFNSDLYVSEDIDLTIRLYEQTEFECVDTVLVRKLQRGHGYRDMAFDEMTHRERVLASRERFLTGLEAKPALTAPQRSALDREWASYFLLWGKTADTLGHAKEARAFYRKAIKKAPFQFRGYGRWVRTLMPWG